MSPSPAERFSALLSRSGERGWSPDDDLGDEDDWDDDDGADGGGDDGGGPTPAGVRPGVSRTLLLCLLGVVLTAVLVLVLAPSLLRGKSPLAETSADWESAHGEATPGAGAAETGASQPTEAGVAGESGVAEVGTVWIHVVGAVGSPGVVELPASSRVSDAVDAAGGARDDADIDALNLARVLVDGEQIRVPRVGEELANQTEAGGVGAAAGGGDAAAGTGGGGLIDLNTADAAQLETLPGIGPVTAQSIIDHREAVGRFGSVDELLDVTGIGDATLGRIRESVTVG